VRYKARGGKGRAEAGQWWAWRDWRRRARQCWYAAATRKHTLSSKVTYYRYFGCHVNNFEGISKIAENRI
jgi:hypothetical protein